MADPVVEPVVEQTPTLSKVEQEAMDHGWQPESEFQADPKNEGKKWRSADDFMDRKSLFDKIGEQHKELRNLKKGIDALSQHNATIEKSAYERALKELRAERKKALEDNDIVRAEEIRDQIDEVRDRQAAAPKVAQSQEAPEFTQWKGMNSWYGNDVALTAWADTVGRTLSGQGKSPAEVLVEVARLAREEFPHKFNKRNPNKDDAPRTNTGGRPAGGSRETFQLTEEESRIMNTMLRAGVKQDGKPMTKESYIAQVKRAKGYQ